jgi:hypothetical protein
VLAIGGQIERNVVTRGSTDPHLEMLSSLSTEDLIPPDHPIRRIRVVVDTVLAELDGLFDAMYASGVGAACPGDAAQVDGVDGDVLDPFWSGRSANGSTST